LILEATAPLKVIRHGQEIRWPQGHLLEWSEEDAEKLLTRVPDKVRRVDPYPQFPLPQADDIPHPTTPAPLQPGWQVVWRDRRGILQDGIVRQMEGTPLGWKVILTTGESISTNKISAVGQIINGKKVGAWRVRFHGLDGQRNRQGHCDACALIDCHHQEKGSGEHARPPPSRPSSPIIRNFCQTKND